MIMKKCPKCGKEIEGNFCPDCGEELKFMDDTDNYSERILHEYNSVINNSLNKSSENVITMWLLRNRHTVKVLGAILCFIGILMNLMTRIIIVIPVGYYSTGWSTLCGLSLTVGLSFLAITCLTEGNKAFLYVTLISILCATICDCIALIKNISYGGCSVLVLLCIAISVCIWLFFLITISRDMYQYIERYNIFFIILPIIMFIVSLVCCVILYNSLYYFYGGIYFVIWISVLLSLFLPVVVFTSTVIIYDNTDKIEANSERNMLGSDEQNGYHSIALLIVLCIFTLCIYNYLWIYRTTKLLDNKLKNSDSTTVQLLLCIFIPFYIIYWVYKTCKNIEECLYRQNNRESNISVIGMVLTLFGLFLIAAAMMQDQINKIVIIDSSYYNKGNDEHIKNSSFYCTTEKSIETNPETDNNYNKTSIKEELNSNQTALKTSAIAEELMEYKDLLDEGLITEEEFTAIKKRILDI